MRRQSLMELLSEASSSQLPGRGLCAAICFLWLLGLASLARAQSMDSPMRIAAGPPGEILVSDSVQGKVLALDSTTLTVDWSFDVQGSPMAVAYAANLVFIGNATTSTCSS